MKFRVSFKVFFRILDLEEFLSESIVPNVHPLSLTDQTFFPDPLDVGFAPYSKQKRQVFQIKMNKSSFNDCIIVQTFWNTLVRPKATIGLDLLQDNMPFFLHAL